MFVFLLSLVCVLYVLSLSWAQTHIGVLEVVEELYNQFERKKQNNQTIKEETNKQKTLKLAELLNAYFYPVMELRKMTQIDSEITNSEIITSGITLKTRIHESMLSYEDSFRNNIWEHRNAPKHIRPEVALCGWQGGKIQELTDQNIFLYFLMHFLPAVYLVAYIHYILHFWPVCKTGWL